MKTKISNEVLAEIARKYKLSPALVWAVAQVESSGRAHVFRFEPRIYAKLLVRMTGYIPDGIPKSTERMQRATSWGPLQILGETARTILKDDTSYMTEYCGEKGIELGCQLLRKHFNDSRNSEEEVLSLYNTGYANSRIGQAYAQKVLSFVKKYPWMA